MQSHFDDDLFDFLVELQANNNREWFGEHKERYERHVKQPLLSFIEDFEPHLHTISKHFVADPHGWDQAVQAPGFAEEFKLTGDSLKRPPKGFDPGHPKIEDLKRKDHVATIPFSEEEVTTAGFIKSFTNACRMASRYAEFLTRAVGLSH